jgi:hypothetical protein
MHASGYTSKVHAKKWVLVARNKVGDRANERHRLKPGTLTGTPFEKDLKYYII